MCQVHDVSFVSYARRLIGSYRLFHTYLVLCNQHLPKDDAETLRKWFQAEQEKEGGDQKLEERWDLDLPELKALVARLG